MLKLQKTQHVGWSAVNLIIFHFLIQFRMVGLAKMRQTRKMKLIQF